MDATRRRRTNDSARSRWYALWRSVRFSRHLGGVLPEQFKKLLSR